MCCCCFWGFFFVNYEEFTFKSIHKATSTTTMRSRTWKLPKRRPLQRKRRGKRSSDSGWYKRLADRKECINSTIKADARLHTLQFNAGSVGRNLTEIKSRIYEETPDLVLVQEDRIMTEATPFSIPHYTWLHRPRTQARRADGPGCT